jgi:hypothetical protein
MAHPVQASGVDWLARVRGRRGPRPCRSSISIRIAAFAVRRPATLGNRMFNLIVRAARMRRVLTIWHTCSVCSCTSARFASYSNVDTAHVAAGGR